MSEKSDGLIKYELFNTHHEKRSFRSFFEMSLFSLFCVVLGNPLRDPFPIDISEINVIDDHHPRVSIEHLSVGHLKRLINNKKSLVSDSDNLTLWNVEGLAEGNDKWGILEQIVTKELNNETSTKQKLKELGAKVLNSSRSVKNIFSDVPKEHVHIIVETSPPATTGKRKMVEDEEDEVQAKKERLQLLQEDKQKIQYLIKNLQSINTNDGKFTVPALPGSDKSTVVYKRKCYDYLLNFILHDELLRRYCITGNPGIGKTYFGILLLVTLLKNNMSVLMDNQDYTAYITPDGNLIPVNDKEYRLYAERPNTWCIIDGVELKVSHDFSGPKLIMVSSPKKQIVEKFTKAQRSEIFYMPPWEIGELYDCQEQLYDKTIAQDSIKEKFDLCGGVARWIFDIAMTPDKIKLKIEGAISLMDLKSLLKAQGEYFSGDGFSHKLIHIKTNEDPSDSPYTKAICTFASNFVENKCLEKFQKDHTDDLRSFIENSRDISEIAVLRGKLFEMWSHAKICKGGTFQVRQLQENSNEETVTFEKLIKEDFSNIKDVNIREGIYYQPVAKNYQSIDSYIHPNQLLQITIADRHGVKQEKLKEYKDKNILNQGEIHLYFIVPEESFRTYRKQNYLDGSKKVESPPKWIQNIKQYALCMKCDKY